MVQNKTIVGIGSALVDILMNVDDDFLLQLNGRKGGMTYVESTFIDNVNKTSKVNTTVNTGGSACNTICGVGMLGGEAYFVGKTGRGNFGNYVRDELQKKGVIPLLTSSNLSTGKVLSAITPDAERTMFTHLGAASELDISDIVNSAQDILKKTDFILIEGYLLFNEELMLQIIELIKDSNAKIVMDLSSYTVVEEKKDFIKKQVIPFVDILIANEDEAFYYTEEKDANFAIKSLSQDVEIAVVNIGEKGSIIANGDNIIKIEANKIEKVIDTTGAGDIWTAGFLFGFMNNKSLKSSGELGSLCASLVCQKIGADINLKEYQKIKV